MNIYKCTTVKPPCVVSDGGGIVPRIILSDTSHSIEVTADTWFAARAVACVRLQCEPFEVTIELIKSVPVTTPRVEPRPLRAPKRSKTKKTKRQ